MKKSCFKAYDIRGRVPEELDEALAYRIGSALTDQLGSGALVVGRDVRLSSESLLHALAKGWMEQGRDVIDIGLCGTEEVYFQTWHKKAAGGVMITASHNPMGYNGMKLVREEAKPISGDSGLHAIQEAAFSESQPPVSQTIGSVKKDHDKSAYIKHLLSYIDPSALKPLKIVCNSGNGGAGLVIDLLEDFLPFEFIKIQHEPDGNFPNGIPNPLLPECRQATAEAVIKHSTDIGIAWDGDFDRCFFFDHTGQFIEGYYLVGLLAEALLKKHPGGKVIHDPRLTWNTIDVVTKAGGIPIQSKTGHAFIKERMREEDAIYGGEMSAHHYFKDFAYCDSGMIPWLLVAELLSSKDSSLASLVQSRIQAYPCSGEINFKVDNADHAIQSVLDHFADQSPQIDQTDGISAEFSDWRFNIRKSNTEPLLRLNVEAKGSQEQCQEQTKKINLFLRSHKSC